MGTMIFRFFENKEGMNYSPVFNALLGPMDEAARGLLLRRLGPELPTSVPDQKTWLEPSFGEVDRRMENHYWAVAQNLKRTLVSKSGLSRLGLLRNCLDYALNDSTKIGGVFDAVKRKFEVAGGRDMFAMITRINDFRNTFVAHHEKEITNSKEAQLHLVGWITGLKALTEASQ